MNSYRINSFWRISLASAEIINMGISRLYAERFEKVFDKAVSSRIAVSTFDGIVLAFSFAEWKDIFENQTLGVLALTICVLHILISNLFLRFELGSVSMVLLWVRGSGSRNKILAWSSHSQSSYLFMYGFTITYDLRISRFRPGSETFYILPLIDQYDDRRWLLSEQVHEILRFRVKMLFSMNVLRNTIKPWCKAKPKYKVSIWQMSTARSWTIPPSKLFLFERKTI